MKALNENDLKEILSTYSKMIYRLAFSRTGNAKDAEDICQEVFFALAAKNPDFESEEDRKAWLIRVAINKANSLWRSAWRKKVILSEAKLTLQNQTQEDSALEDILAKLSGKDKMLIQLHYYEGFKLEEIASILNKPSATIRSQLHRARKRLKKLMEKELYDNG